MSTKLTNPEDFQKKFQDYDLREKIEHVTEVFLERISAYDGSDPQELVQLKNELYQINQLFKEFTK